MKGGYYMFKVGILGSDNSHALAFSKLVNLRDEKTGEYLFPDVRIVGIYGHDREQTEKVAKEGNLEFVADKPEDLMGKVDAVMVVFRHGNLHAQYALPFIKAGIPTWIDKPFTIKKEDALKLIEAADAGNVLVTGGSTNKYLPDVIELKNSVENDPEMGSILTGALSYTSYLDNEYGGIYFYGPHLVEMTMAVFGYDAKSVYAKTDGRNINAIVGYDRYNVVMNFIDSWRGYFGIVHGSKKTVAREINTADGYRLGFEKFAEMLRTGRRPFSLDKLLMPTIMLNALDRSMKTGREVLLADI